VSDSLKLARNKMSEQEKLIHTSVLTALQNESSIEGQQNLLSFYSMEIKKYPHINILYREQIKTLLRYKSSFNTQAKTIFTDTFSQPIKPPWLNLHCSVWSEEERRRSSLIDKQTTYKKPILNHPDHSDEVNISNNPPQDGYVKENNAQNGFVRANRLLPKKRQQRNESPKDEGTRKKFVPPFANPDKRAEYSTVPKEPPTKQKEEKSVKKENDKLIEQIESEILDNSPCVSWNEIAGLDYAKKTIEEILILPITMPELREIIDLPHGILLFGPPGTGKTMIAKAVATECKSTFFNISSSILTSKWMGESEKLVRTLFEVARQRQPSIIFIDEIDSLLCARSENDFESSRRIKTEFLVKMDGVANGRSQDDQVIIIGATNRPQELDEAVKRRLGKRLYIPLPNKTGRIDFLTKALGRLKLGNSLSKEEIEELAVATKGYSGADLKHLISEASMYPVRTILGKRNVKVSELRKISYEDFKSALGAVKPTVSKDELGKYLEWNASYGCCPFSEADLDN